MIKNKKITIKVSNATVKFYISKGYICEVGDILEISVDDLPKQSTVKIDAICDICKNEKKIEYRKYINNFNNKKIFTCSRKCSDVKIKMTKKEKYGDENFNNIKKRKITCKEKYNNENYKNVKKRQQTNIDKYGYKNALENPLIKEKRVNTLLIKYGETHQMKNLKIKNKKIKSSYINGIYNNNIDKTLKTTKVKLFENIKKFNVTPVDYKNKIYFLKCDKNHTFESNYDLIYKRNLYNVEQCTICNPINTQNSNREKELLIFIEKIYNGNILTNNRKIITPYELDIYLPDLNLAFEFNGLYWHNEDYKPNNYHLNKTNECKKLGIQLIHIWEDDWLYKNEIVKSMILNKLGKTTNKIYGRKTEVREVTDNRLIRKFLNDNHIQGFVGSRIKLGLYYENKLVSLMTFKKTTLNNYELNRFCNEINIIVIGGASKLFKYFNEKYDVNNITSFSNNAYSSGDLYLKLNFRVDKLLQPDFHFILNHKREHKFNFRKNRIKYPKIKKDLKKIYDAGKIKFIYP